MQTGICKLVFCNFGIMLKYPSKIAKPLASGMQIIQTTFLYESTHL